MNMQKQPEKKQFTTASSLVVFYTNDFSDLTDKSTSQGQDNGEDDQHQYIRNSELKASFQQEDQASEDPQLPCQAMGFVPVIFTL